MPKVTACLTDIFTVEALQRLQDSLAAITGQGVVAVSCEGAPYTKPSGQCPQKPRVRRELCEEAGADGRYAFAAVEEWAAYAMPAYLNDALLGCWVFYGRESMQERELEKLAAHIGALNGLMEQMFEWEDESEEGARQEAQNKKDEKDMLRSLQTLLQDAHKRRGYITIAMVQVEAESAYGRIRRERLFSRMEEAMRAVVRTDDIVARMQGDAFMVALPGCAKQLAEQRIWQGKERLERMRLTGGAERTSFHFGLVENSELPYDKNPQRYARGFLQLAEQRMRECEKSGRAVQGGLMQNLRNIE